MNKEVNIVKQIVMSQDERKQFLCFYFDLVASIVLMKNKRLLLYPMYCMFYPSVCVAVC